MSRKRSRIHQTIFHTLESKRASGFEFAERRGRQREGQIRKKGGRKPTLDKAQNDKLCNDSRNRRRREGAPRCKGDISPRDGRGKTPLEGGRDGRVEKDGRAQGNKIKTQFESDCRLHVRKTASSRHYFSSVGPSALRLPRARARGILPLSTRPSPTLLFSSLTSAHFCLLLSLSIIFSSLF